MRKPGRTSAAELATQPAMNGRRSRLSPPESLTTDEAALFSELVTCCDARHFNKADLPVLITFIQTTMVVRDLAGDPDRFVSWEKAARLQASLATRLRLTPASRTDPKTIGRRQPELDGPMPWERDQNEED